MGRHECHVSSFPRPHGRGYCIVTIAPDLNPRSGCQHKAWGGAKRNPRNPSLKIWGARGAGDSRWGLGCRPLRGLNGYWWS
jgi:hypothetical protein